MKSESIKELAEALAKVKFGEIGKSKSVKVQTKTGGSYSFQYAPMEAIMSAIRKPLAEQGLSLTQTVFAGNVETTLLHSSGEWILSHCPIVLAQKFDGDGKELKPTAQEMGSAITYARRYGVTLACCLVADEDDDANIADGNEFTTKTQPYAAPHKPTDGVWDALPTDVQTWLHDLSNQVRSLLTKGDVKGACDHLDEQNLDNEKKVAIWTRFDSKERTAMTKYRDMLKARA